MKPTNAHKFKHSNRPTNFGHSCGQPQGVYYKGYCTKLYESMHRCKILKLIVGFFTISN